MQFKALIILLSLLFSALAGCTAAPPVEQITPEPVATLRAQPVGDSVRVGVLAIRSAVAANAQYGGIIAYLEQEVGRPFTLVPMTQEEQFSLVDAGDLDFTFNNPLSGVEVQRLYGTEFLATLSRVNTGPYFSGLIIVRADSDIHTIEDLRGAEGTCVNHETAAAGCIFQVYHLTELGIDPYTDFATFTETPSQDNIVLGVLNQTFDVGFVRTGQLERMLREGTLLTLEDIRILDQAQDDFYLPHTTILYPEWPFAALADTDPELAREVKEALLRMPADHPALAEIGSDGFVDPVDYESMNQLIETLQLISWDAPEN